MRLEIGRLGEEGFVGRDDGQVVVIGEPEQAGLDRRLVLALMALDLDIEPVAEDRREALQSRFRLCRLARAQGEVERPARSTGQGNDIVVIACEMVDARDRAAAGRSEAGFRHQLHQIAVAGFAGRQQHDMRHHALERLAPACVLIGEIDRKLHAGDRLDAGARQLLGEFECAEQVVGIGQRHRRLAVAGRELGERADLDRAFEQRIARMDMEVDEADLVLNLCIVFAVGHRALRRAVHSAAKLGGRICADSQFRSMLRTAYGAPPLPGRAGPSARLWMPARWRSTAATRRRSDMRSRGQGRPDPDHSDEESERQEFHGSGHQLAGDHHVSSPLFSICST